jgi:hypothetical protein
MSKVPAPSVRRSRAASVAPSARSEAAASAAPKKPGRKPAVADEDQRQHTASASSDPQCEDDLGKSRGSRLGRPGTCKCSACGVLSNAPDTPWHKHDMVKTRDRGDRMVAVEDKCRRHGLLYHTVFEELMSWPDFCKRYDANVAFRTIADNIEFDAQGEVVATATHETSVSVELCHFLEIKRSATCLSPDGLLARMKQAKPSLTKLPDHIKSIPTINVPVLREGDDGIPQIQYEKRFLFADAATDSEAQASIITLYGPKISDKRFCGKPMFEGQQNAMMQHLMSRHADTIGSTALLSDKKALEPLDAYVARKFRTETATPLRSGPSCASPSFQPRQPLPVMPADDHEVDAASSLEAERIDIEMYVFRSCLRVLPGLMLLAIYGA